MSNLKFRSFIFIFIIVNIMSCGKDENTNDCHQNLICTQIFVSITANVQWKSNDLKWLKSKTILKRTNEIIYSDTLSEYSVITIMSDGGLSKIKKEGDDLILEIYNENNQLLKTENYIIGHDCCHVLKISGPEIITLD